MKNTHDITNNNNKTTAEGNSQSIPSAQERGNHQEKMSKQPTNTQPRIGTPKATPSGKTQPSIITDWFQVTPPVTHHQQATDCLSHTLNNTHHYETRNSGLEVVSNNVLLSESQLSIPKTNCTPTSSSVQCQDNYVINIIVNNIAGLGISTGKMDLILQWLTNTNVDILLGQEANVSFRHPQIQTYFRGPQCSHLHITSSETEWVYQRPYKPGGTFCLSTQRMRSRVIRRIQDQAGRWSGTVYQFKGGVQIATISIYQVTKTTTKGITSVRSQQNAWLRKHGRKEDPRKALHIDIKETIQKLQKENVLIIVGGDFNDSDKLKGLHYVLSTELGLQDAWGSQTAPHTYIRGTECIDYVYVSHKLLQCIQVVNYLPFPTAYSTDHRPIHLQLNVKSLSHTSLENLNLRKKKIHSNDPENVKIYVTQRYELYKHHKIQDKMETILTALATPNKSNSQIATLIKRMNQVDDELTLISLQAERSIRPRSTIYSSPTINKLRESLHEVRKLIHQSKAISPSQLEHIKRRKQLIATLRQAVKQQHIIRHREEIDKLNNMVQNGTDAAKKWAKQRRSQLTINKLKRIYNKLSYVTGKRLDRIPLTVQSQVNGHIEILQDPDEIAQAIQEHNRKHFSQAKGGFFNQDTTRNVNDAANIRIDSQLPQSQEHRLVSIMQNMTPEVISSDISIKEWETKFRKWREKTRTSPSGVHLGHYKSLLKPVMEGEDDTMEENLIILNMQNTMFQTQLDIVNLATELGEPLHRWQKATNIAIPKQPGILNIDKFRNIHIYECDLNAMLSIKWNEALSKLEEAKAIICNQYGSRKAMSSWDPVQMETLQLDNSRITRRDYGQINYDARACYDRILPNLAAMANRAHGIPDSIVKLHFKLLHNMVYEIQIEGAQPVQFKNEKESPVFGTGQGSGNSPTIWTFISNILLKSMEQQANGAHYYANNEEEVVVKTTAFVDDVNTHHTSTKETSLDDAMIQDYQRWESILKSSGGTLAPEKCNFYKLRWSFSPTGQPVIAQHNRGKVDDHVDPIQKDGAHKSLGYMMSPTFGPKHQLQHWAEKEHKFQRMLNNHPLTSSEVEILYKNIYIPTMRYIMPFTCSKKDHIRNVASKSISLFLKKFGYASTTSRDVVYGPVKLGGLGWYDLELETGISQLERLLHALNDENQLGLLTRATIANWCWHIGFSPFENNHIKIKHDETNWLQHISEFVHSHNIHLECTIKGEKLAREGDVYIMEQAYKLNLTGAEIRYVNYCRLYLDVISLADISDEQGSHVIAQAWDRVKAHKLSVGNRARSVQQLPSPSSWTAWKRVIQSFTHPTRRRLKIQLGVWTADARDIRAKFKSYRTQEMVYIQHAAHMSVHTIQQEAIDRNAYTLTSSPIPNNAIPCFVSATGDIHTSFQRQITTPQNRIPQSHHNHLLIVSDASVINGNATWAFTIATPDGHQIISQSGKVRGQNITSFRAELSGVLAALIETREFAPDAKYTVYCDNKSVITRLNSMQSIRPQVSWSDYDLLYTCYVNFPRQVLFEHVKGHQDRVNSREELPIAAQLNILMDQKAAQAHTDPNTPQELRHTSTISLNGKVLTGKLTTSLRNEVNTNRITQYYQRKFGEHHDKVLWDVFYGAISHYKRLPKGVHKMIHNIAPTQQVQCQRKLLPDDSCFFCNTSVETIQHVVTCPSRLMDCKSLFLQDIRGLLKLNGTRYDNVLTHTYEGILQINKPPDHTWSLQDQIGWHRCIRGFLSKEWIEYISIVQVEGKSDIQILQLIIQSIWKVWNRAWFQRNEDIDPMSRYHIQIQDYQQTIDLKTIYECYTRMSKQDPLLQRGINIHLQETRENLAYWIAMYRDTFRNEIDTFDPDLWLQVQSELRAQSLNM